MKFTFQGEICLDLSEIIRYENESTYVDFKRDQYQDKEAFLKDIMAMANANTEAKKRYIIIGVKHIPNGTREYHSIPDDEFKDDSEYQNLVRNNVEPEIKFSYKPFDFEGHLLGVFEITDCNQRPYSMKKSFGKVEQGACYIRRGSQQGRAVRADLEIMYEERYKKQRERDIKFSYLHLLKREFMNNRTFLYRMDTFMSEGPIIAELWTPAAEISNHFILEAWDSLMRSGIIASLEFEEMETYRYAVKTIRDAIYYVREAKSNWLRILTWDNPMIESNVQPPELRQPTSPKIVLQQNVRTCKEGIKIAQEAIEKAIRVLEENHGV